MGTGFRREIVTGSLLEIPATSQPATPPAGYARVWVDATTKRLTLISDDGLLSEGSRLYAYNWQEYRASVGRRLCGFSHDVHVGFTDDDTPAVTSTIFAWDNVGVDSDDFTTNPVLWTPDPAPGTWIAGWYGKPAGVHQIVCDNGGASTRRLLRGMQGITPVPAGLPNGVVGRWYLYARMAAEEGVEHIDGGHPVGSFAAAGLWDSPHYSDTNPDTFSLALIGAISHASETHFGAYFPGEVPDTLVSTVALDINVFHDFEMWYDGTATYIRVDGNQVSSAGIAINEIGLPLFIVSTDRAGTQKHLDIDRWLVLYNYVEAAPA